MYLSKFKTFPVWLEEAGYFSGWTGKGWGPGNLKAGGWGKDSPLGQCYNQKNINEDTKQGLDVLPFDHAANFSQFLRDKPKVYRRGAIYPEVLSCFASLDAVLYRFLILYFTSIMASR